MKHMLVEAYWKLGEREEAIAIIRDYWGKMAEFGADTFFELFDPQNPKKASFDPCIGPGENDYMINSYCHAWSCTPAYFIRMYYGME